ncbi:MAG: formylglycine-generating enzyme family protein [Planctomycetes bacterium]|nr:formylglycine-generating enzyme family protein [Planctomycetota bacterium]
MRCALVFVLLASLSVTARAQVFTGRTMEMLVPAVVGQTASFRIAAPSAAAGNVYVVFWCAPPFTGQSPITIPGVTIHGLLRVDLHTSVSPFSGVLGATGSAPHDIPIPNQATLVGYAWNLQSVDANVAAQTMWLADDDLALTVAGAVPSDLVPIAPGSFQMGSTQGRPWEQPVHTVHITRPFWIGSHEVTQAEYEAVTGSNPSWFQPPHATYDPDRPVDRVSWNLAMSYCVALTALEAAANRLPTGYEYRLPTEAEWEYCCRAGTTTEWNVGASLSCSQANFNDNGSYCVPPGETVTVGSYAPNAWGLHDMHGNVEEWCLDSCTNDTPNYPSGPVSDPYVSTGSDRILRGGAWAIYPIACRSANRFGLGPSNRSYVTGFRVVLAPVR